MPKYSSVTQSFRILIYLLKNYFEIISETSAIRRLDIKDALSTKDKTSSEMKGLFY